jgi:hypothetical protein
LQLAVLHEFSQPSPEQDAVHVRFTGRFFIDCMGWRSVPGYDSAGRATHSPAVLQLPVSRTSSHLHIWSASHSELLVQARLFDDASSNIETRIACKNFSISNPHRV